MLTIEDRDDNPMAPTALLDTGAQGNFISLHLAEETRSCIKTSEPQENTLVNGQMVVTKDSVIQRICAN